jgi:hypothetical protein
MAAMLADSRLSTTIGRGSSGGVPYAVAVDKPSAAPRIIIFIIFIYF